MDSDPLKFEEEDLILKVGECLEVRKMDFKIALGLS